MLFIVERSQVYKEKRDGLCKSRDKIPEDNFGIRTISSYQGNYILGLQFTLYKTCIQKDEGSQYGARTFLGSISNPPTIDSETIKLSTVSLFINLGLCSYYRRQPGVNGSFGAYDKNITSSTTEHGAPAL